MFASFLLASLMVAKLPPLGRYGNWIASCDNVRHCEAVALPAQDGSETEWTLSFERNPDADAKPAFEISPAFGDPVPNVRLRLDGNPMPVEINNDGILTGDPVELLRSLSRARKAELVDTSGKVIGTLPVRGASAALRWIDHQQQRSGGTTAIVARGPLSASTVPSPPPLPRIKQPPASNRSPRELGAMDINAVQARGGGYCQPERADPSYYRLDDRHTLAIVGCMLGAYQGSALVIIVEENGRWRPAQIEQPIALDPEYSEPFDAYMLTGADYWPEGRLLSSAAKGRGLADCGSSASWAWDGQAFRLASYRALDECKGAMPGTWLLRWQTANSPLRPDE